MIDTCRQKGEVVILTDGDVVFQPRKIERSGLFEAVEGNILIYVHKEHELDDVERRYPADRYVLVDDKLRILTAIKVRLGSTVSLRSFPGRATTPWTTEAVSKFPPADIEIKRIGDLLDVEL